MKTASTLLTLAALCACGSPTDDAGRAGSERPSPHEDAPAEEAPRGEAPAAEPPPEEAPSEEVPSDEAPSDEAPPDEAPPDEAPSEEAPSEGATPEQAPAACPLSSPQAAPASCPFESELVIYGQEGWNVLGDALAPVLSDCTHAFISIPPRNDDKTQVREGEAAAMRARGPRMHPMAEFHFTTWNRKRVEEGLSWREIGMQFREEMEREGYCIEAGDTWAINEAPSTLRKDATFRAGFAQLLRGLSEGRPGMPFAKGAVFIVGFGHKSENVSVYKANVKNKLADAAFWTQVNNAVRFWGQEVYVDPQHTCVTGATVAERRARVNRYAMHLHRLSVAAPDSAGVNTAQSFLGRAFVPVVNAVWDAAPERGYGDTRLSLPHMKRFIRMQVDAIRNYASANAAPDGRIGFAFASYHDPQEWQALGDTMADAVAGAYGEGGVAADACGAEGCACIATGASANAAWESFSTW